MGEMRILSAEKGDYKVIWDPENETEVEMAQKQFEELKKKRFKAFRVGTMGKKAAEMKEFDPDAGKIIMAPIVQGG